MAVSRVRADHAKGLRELQADHPEPARRVVVSLDPTTAPPRTASNFSTTPPSSSNSGKAR